MILPDDVGANGHLPLPIVQPQVNFSLEISLSELTTIASHCSSIHSINDGSAFYFSSGELGKLLPLTLP